MTKDSDDNSRDIILKRRRRFVIASAAASISIAGCDKPQACLNISEPQEPDAGTTAAPMPCLEVAPQVCLKVQVVEDAGADGGDAGTTTDAGGHSATADAGTQPEPQPQPKPRVCLRFAPPIKDEK